MSIREAMLYEEIGDRRVRCRLCCHHCLIEPGQCGICRVRENRDGRLVSLVYGRPVAQAVDPIEKKPLYHFLPGSQAFSIGTYGCNFRCLHCQNCDIAQVTADEDISRAPWISPEDVVRQAVASGCESIAYTYTEPTVFYEYVYEIAWLAREQGLKNILVTNGYITDEALRRIAPLLDAVNIDLKFFRDDLYRKVCGARLQPVLDAVRLYHEIGAWVEITTLVIPGFNDDTDQLRRTAGFIAGVHRRIPWHISAFHPAYKLTEAPATPVSTLREAATIGRAAGLKHIYPGNVDEHSDTLCPDCGAVLIERSATGLDAVRVNQGRCPQCSSTVAGVW